jgi:hypothetical protein
LKRIVLFVLLLAAILVLPIAAAETFIVVYMSGNRRTSESVVQRRQWEGGLPPAGSRSIIMVRGEIFREEFDAIDYGIENLDEYRYVVFFHVEQYERAGDFQLIVHPRGVKESDTVYWQDRGQITQENIYSNTAAVIDIENLIGRPYIYEVSSSAFYSNYYLSSSSRRSLSTRISYTAFATPLSVRVPGYSDDPVNATLRSLCDHYGMSSVPFFVITADGVSSGDYVH